MSRFHPYGAQSQSNKDLENRKLITMESISNQNKINVNREYERQSYLASTSKFNNNNNNNNNSYPANLQKGILKNRTNIQENRQPFKPTNAKKQAIKKQAVKKTVDDVPLVFDVTTKTAKDLAQITSEKKKSLPNFILVIHGILDSVITKEDYKREFSLKDDFGRIRCTFNEIDRKLYQNISRGSCIRLSGKYDEINSELKCWSVRVATQNEILIHNRNVSQTNAYIKKNFV